MTDLDDISRLIGLRRGYVIINLEAAKEIKELPIVGELEQLLEETRDKWDRLQQHLPVYQNLRVQNSLVNQNTIRSWKIMKNMLVLEAVEFVVELSSKMAMIKDRMDFK